jgi:hypothetical protein
MELILKGRMTYCAFRITGIGPSENADKTKRFEQRVQAFGTDLET